MSKELHCQLNMFPSNNPFHSINTLSKVVSPDNVNRPTVSTTAFINTDTH